MSFCLDDGRELLYGPASQEPATAVFSADAAAEPRTAILSAMIDRSDESRLRSIAVLPFANVSADPDNEYFCDGLAEELLNALAKIDGLKVAARASAFSFKGKQTEAREIGRALNVTTVLDGSVRKAGDRIRINVQVVNADDGYQLWSERYDRELKDIFDVQDEIAIAVVDALKIKLLGDERAALLKRHTESAEAYEFYLRGLSHFARWTPTDFQRAIENFERAITIDPQFASAYAGLADAYTELAFFSFSAGDARVKAKKAADTALELDSRLAEGHNSLGLIKMYFDWDYASAEAEFKTAIALNPGNASVRMWYGWYLGLMGRYQESLAELQRARELDPLSPPNNNGIAVVLLWSGRTDEAVTNFHGVLDLYPNYPVACSFLAEAYVEKGQLASALDTIRRIPPEAMDPQSLAVMGYVYARSGDRARALQILDEFAERSDRELVPAVNFAHVYAGLGDNDAALAWLQKAIEERSVWLSFLRVDLKFRSLHADTRFRALLHKAGFID